ncbi:hypothetical protein [Bacillus dakarensis]|uniref:hypothetical protein n=1 Tax=Robertmurraya dakarensis TaxID=1926278 RepID=UPI00137B238A|nr:hypothetical protein [Bacillus dakarensis]
MLELLLSLMIWMLLSLWLLPVYIHVSKQHNQIQQEIEATHVLYETIQDYLLNGNRSNKTIVRSDLDSYTIVWSKEELDSLEVCIQYKNRSGKDIQNCETIQS